MKIKYSLLEKWCKNNLTNKESSVLLYIAHYQDAYGRIKGIYYRDVCCVCEICKQTFYDVLRALKRKGIITYTHGKDDYDITILDNDFSYPGSYNEGYINVSRSVFDSKRFSQLTARAKMLLMLLMKVTHENGKTYQIGRKKFYEKYTELLGVTERVLRGYLHTMRNFFSVGSKDGKYFITYLASVFKEKRVESEIDQYLGHIVKVNCRHNKIKDLIEKDIKDTVRLIKQYREMAKEHGQDILEVMSGCIKDSVVNKTEKYLNSRYIHLLIRKVLGLGKLTMADMELEVCVIK